MVKTKKLGLLVFCILLILVIPMLLSGCGNVDNTPTQDYTLHNYYVTMNVKDDGKITVQETFTVKYNTNTLHGVSRYVPTKLTAYYDRDNKVVKKRYRVEIEDAQVLSGDCADKGENGDFYVFMLGNAYRYVVSGEVQTYSIQYTFNMPDDRLSDMDVLYYNVLPFDWDTSITNANFVINFDFDVSKQDLYDKTVVYFGEAGTTNLLNNVTFDDSKISGSVEYIPAFNGVTVYTEFNEGVLGNKSSTYWLVAIIGLVVLIIMTIVIWFYYRKKRVVRHLVPTVEFKAPDGLTPAECGLILDGKVDNRDLVSMIIYWASRGYLQIIDKDDEVYLKKLKDLDDSAKSYEKTIFSCIFASKKDEINIKDIESFGEKLLLAKAQLRNDIKHLNYEPKTKSARASIDFWGVVVPVAVMGIMLALGVQNLYILFILAELILLVGVFSLYNYAVDKEFYNSRGLTIFYKILCLIIMVAIPIVYMILAFELYIDKFMLVILSHIFSIFMLYLGAKVLSRTQFSNDRLGKIIGLKNFILVTEKDKMEMLVKDNPKSFYDILPYAYVLNVTDVYCEKFEDIDLSPPDWYVNTQALDSNAFTTLYFMTALNSSLNHTYSTLLSATNNVILKKVASVAGEISKSSGGSGGGRSGGGFGGGGFGGGGGRGW